MLSINSINAKLKPSLSLLIIAVVLLFSTYGCEQRRAQLMDGDIVFQRSLSGQSLAIQLATKSPYSHVGIIYIKEGAPFVYEAVGPVKLTPFKKWLRNGEDKSYAHKRLKNRDKILTKANIEKLKKAALKYNGKPYDIYFNWNSESIYCSELIYKVYFEGLGIELGEKERLGSFDLTHPEVKRLLKERYGENIPVNEVIVSPASIFSSDKLELISLN